MVSSVNTNINALAAVQSLMDIGNQMTATQSAIESGLKVNSASDNPAVFTIAQGLRANVNALQAVADNLATGTATVQAATQGATSISNALTTLLQTVTQAQGQTGAALAASNLTITNALSNIDAYANAATLNGTNLLSGAGATLNVLSNVSGATTSVTTTGASVTALGLTGLSVNTGGTTITPTTTFAAGNTFTYTDGSGNKTAFEFTTGTAVLTTVPSAGEKLVGVTLGANNGASIGNFLTALQNNGVAASENSSGVITVTGGAAVNNIVQTTGVTATVATLGAGLGAIAAVNAAITNVGSTLSSLGATTVQLQGLSSFTAALSASVTTGLGALVDANLSAESAKLSSLQTKQSLAIQSLSLANQGPGALLQLFR